MPGKRTMIAILMYLGVIASLWFAFILIDRVGSRWLLAFAAPLAWVLCMPGSFLAEAIHLNSRGIEPLIVFSSLLLGLAILGAPGLCAFIFRSRLLLIVQVFLLLAYLLLAVLLSRVL
jgi:hypothetical protein